jgi:hypothetical protein
MLLAHRGHIRCNSVSLCYRSGEALASAKSSQRMEGATGTKHCARQAIEAGIPTYLIDAEEAVPGRLLADDPWLE